MRNLQLNAAHRPELIDHRPVRQTEAYFLPPPAGLFPEEGEKFIRIAKVHSAHPAFPVIHYKLKLYTGTAGFIRVKGDWNMLFLVLVGNIIACGITALAASYAQPDILTPDMAIVQSRLDKGPLACFLLAIGCGFIMTTAVQFGRAEKFLPVLFGVPVFILCGFTHSIADAFYFLAVPELYSTQLLAIYIAEVLGNFAGCNLYRWVIAKQDKV